MLQVLAPPPMIIAVLQPAQSCPGWFLSKGAPIYMLPLVSNQTCGNRVALVPAAPEERLCTAPH